MGLEIYISNNRICCDVLFNDKKRRINYKQMVDLLYKLIREDAPKIEPNENGYNLTYKDVNVVLRDYEKLLEDKEIKRFNKKTYKKIQQEHANDKIKENKSNKINRNASKRGKQVLAVVTSAVIIFGVGKIVKSIDTMETKIKESTYSFQEEIKDEPPVIEKQIDEDLQFILDSALEENVNIEKNVNDQVVIEQELAEEKNISYVNLSYDDRSNNEKIINTRNNYGEIITKYANMYGLDANLMIALATQERGTHSEIVDNGGAIGLMQIEYNVWNKASITAYNHETKSNETVNIDGQSLGNLDYNVKVACMIFQNSLVQNKYNIIAALQGYNFGYGNMEKVLCGYGNDHGLTKSEVLNDYENTDWLEYRSYASGGDKEYVEHVLSYLGNDISMNVQTPDGELIMVDLSKTNQKIKS